MTEYRPVAIRIVSSRSDMTAASAAGSRDSPLAVGTSPLATAARAGSSSWTSNWAPGTRLATSATCAAAPSAREPARSATAPGSASTGLSVRASSMVAARVQGPHRLILSGPS